MIPQTRAGVEIVSREKLAVNVGETLTSVNCLGGAFEMLLYNKDESLTQAIANNGFWESWVTAWHVQNIGEGDVYVDLGANAGYYSFLAEYLGASVYAFEANPRYFDLIGQSSVLNGSNVMSICKAVTDTEGGSIRLNFYGDLDGSASIVGEGWDGKGIDVSTTKLDYWRFPAGNLIVKMDIEGAEEIAWDGMQETLRYRKPTVILEYTPGAYSQFFYDKLNEYGKVSKLNFDAYEEITSHKHVESLDDWCTLVIRPWK